MSENPSCESTLIQETAAIHEIIAKMQDVKLFSQLCENAQARIALRIDDDPVGYVMHIIQKVREGLDQEDSLLSEAEELLNLAYKVACEYGRNQWLTSKVSHCLSALGTKNSVEVRNRVLKVLGEE